MVNLATLSERQREILVAYVRCLDEWEGQTYPPPCPTIRGLMRKANITSTSVARYHLQYLSRAGVIVHVRNSGKYYLNPDYVQAIRSLAMNHALV